MAVPKQRKTKSRRNNRRMHIHLPATSLAKCEKCGSTKRAHAVCSNCGYYNKGEVINVLQKLDKKERKLREKEISAKEAEEKSLTMEGLSKK